MQKPYLIVTVNYNCWADTQQFLQSLDIYDRKRFDVMVVENKSNDDYEVIEKYGKEHNIYTHLAEKNLGFAGGNNLGVRMAQKISGNTYEYILLLNPDTVLDQQDFFQNLYNESIRVNADIIGPKITEYSDTSKLYFAGGWLNKTTLFPSKRGKGEKDTGQYNKTLRCDYITGSAIAIKSTLRKKLGGIDTRYFLYFEETDFCIRAVRMYDARIFWTPVASIGYNYSASVGRMSDIYIYHMIRNYKVLAYRFLSGKNLYIRRLFYICFWCPVFVMLGLKSGNWNTIKNVWNGILGATLEYETQEKKKFLRWTTEKFGIHDRHQNTVYINPNEIWYAKLGINIGYEQNGSENFRRPVLVLKQVGSLYTVLPLTSKTYHLTGDNKDFYHHIQSWIGETDSVVILSQLRVIDKKRIMGMLGVISNEEIEVIKQKTRDLHL